MSEFSIGDRVRIKTWEELLQECEDSEDLYLSSDKQSVYSIKHLPGFVEEMRKLCGETATIIDIIPSTLPGSNGIFDRIYLEFDDVNSRGYWRYDAYMMVPIDDMEYNDFPSVIDFYN